LKSISNNISGKYPEIDLTEKVKKMFKSKVEDLIYDQQENVIIELGK